MAAQEVIVGVVLRPHGVRGELVIELRTDEPERRFAPGGELQASPVGNFTVRGTRQVSGRFVLSLIEVNDRDAAEKLRGKVLTCQVDNEEMPVAKEEYYDRQLIGLRVFAADGSERGVVRHIIHGPAQDLLEVEVAGELRLVPFVAALVPQLDLEAGWLQLAPVSGLLEDQED